MNEKAWTKWSAFAEIISSVAIVITLVYLAVQTSQNTDALLSQSRQNIFEASQAELPIWMQYPELTVFIIDNSLEMTLEQKTQLDNMMILSIGRREFAWRQYNNGVLDRESWEVEKQVISLLLGTERTRSWWANVGKFGRDPEFAAQIDMLLKDQPLHPYWIALKNWQTGAQHE